MNVHSSKLRGPTAPAIVPLLVTALLALTMFLVPAPAAHAAEGDPSVTVSSKTEHIDGSATTFVVPVAFDDGIHDVSSVSFVLDYDAACVRINNTDTDITGVQSGFTSSVNNDRDAGKLQVSIWRDGAQSTLTSGTLISIRFTLEPACRPGESNLTDPTTAFTFVSPEPTFGSTLGANIPGDSTDGTYTLDLNQRPTDISAGSLAMTENVSGARQIATFSATDSDNAPADTLTFALAGTCSGEFDNQGFVLDPANSANLLTDRVFDYEGLGSYAVCVQVTDGQGGAYVEKLTLAVVNANDTPSDIALSANTVAQGVAAGTTVGTLTTSDEDTGQTFTYTLLETGEGSADSAKFTIAGDLLKINSPVNYLVQPEYKVRIQATDNGDPAKSFAKQFRVLVNGISTLALPTEPDLPLVMAGERVTVPVSFAPNGNNVLAASFQVNYSETCLDYVELTGIQAGFSDSDADVADDGHVDVSLSTAGQAPLAKGAPVSIIFAGTGCAAADAWTALTFEANPTMTGAGNVAFATAKSDGKLVVVAADAAGDCNADGSVNAGDFSATALELFDAESSDETGARPMPNSWLWTPLGARGFSARGCDSNTDRTMLVSDLQCTVRLFFGASCTAATVSAASTQAPAIVSAPAEASVFPGQVTSVPLVLKTNDHDVAAFAASVSFDPTKLKLDPTDSDADGVPDAVHFDLPGGMYRAATYDAAAGKVDLVATGIVMPLPKLADGVVVTLNLQPLEGAEGKATPLTVGNLSLGDSEGGTVPVMVETDNELSAGGRVFMPAVMQ